jgi:hypothetical protein
MMRRLTVHLAVAFGLALAFAALTAEAQSPGTMNGSRIGQSVAHENGSKTTNAPKANDKAYNAALKNLPDKQYDPWHGVR